ncbi:hypothetical protein B0H14DRAFT_2920334 [Mycena olivaceomarginata]|nr:hypothetical protein B0H14DRAFT_2920334 [Mycena olivaceomarginata]
MMIVQADVWLGLLSRRILRTGLGQRDWTMRTLGVVHALVSYLRVQTTDFIQHRTLPRAARGHIHRYQVRSGSLSCFTDLVRCEPLRSRGALWSTGRAGAYLRAALTLGFFKWHSGKDHLLERVATVIQVPAWARGSDRVGGYRRSSSGDGASILSVNLKCRINMYGHLIFDANEKHCEPYRPSDAIGPFVARLSVVNIVLFYITLDS